MGNHGGVMPPTPYKGVVTMASREEVKAKVIDYMKRHEMQYKYMKEEEKNGVVTIKVRTMDYTELEAVQKNGRTTFKVDGKVKSIKS